MDKPPNAVLEKIRMSFVLGIKGATRTTFKIVFTNTVKKLREIGRSDEDVIKCMHQWGREAGITRQWVNSCLRDNGITQRTPGTPPKRKPAPAATTSDGWSPEFKRFSESPITPQSLADLVFDYTEGDATKAAIMLIDASEIAMTMKSK